MLVDCTVVLTSCRLMILKDYFLTCSVVKKIR